MVSRVTGSTSGTTHTLPLPQGCIAMEQLLNDFSVGDSQKLVARNRL